MKRGSEAAATRNPGPQPETLSSQPVSLCWGRPCPEDAFTSDEGRPSSHTSRTVCCLEPSPSSDVIRFLQKQLAQPGLCQSRQGKSLVMLGAGGPRSQSGACW